MRSPRHGRGDAEQSPLEAAPDCRDCPTFRDAHWRALADRRTSSDYLRILAGSGLVRDRRWIERLIVAADELDTLAEAVGVFDRALDAGAQIYLNGAPVVCKMPGKKETSQR